MEQEILAMAQQQWLDPQILAMAMEATQGGTMDPNMIPGIWLPDWVPNWIPNPDLTIQDTLNTSPLAIHADEMMPMIQTATQDEIMFFIKKILDFSLNQWM